jgi:primosomal protein N' (replication factor Y) (superfamily II helicase)
VRPSDRRSIARVALDVPLPELFDYRCDDGVDAEPGDWVLVPWGKARRVGLVVETASASSLAPERIRPIERIVAGMPRMPDHWLGLIDFASRYYHCGFGELALPSVPKLLRAAPTARSRGSAIDRARERFAPCGSGTETAAPPTLTPEQQHAVESLRDAAGHHVTVLHGITGSGKTEVYLRWLAGLLAADPTAQAMMLVPEIALTPQLAERLGERFPGMPLAILHSDMPDAERAANWLAAADGRARIVLGTRLAVLAPLPGLVAIVVDEEHDASFKQQEGARYSARDLAIALASRRGLPVLLGSATPSLETWQAVRRGRYRLLALKARAGGASRPVVRRVLLRSNELEHGLAKPAIEAIRGTIARGEQALLFLNRRGFAPVLSCEACGWLSRCDQCDAYRVLHRVGARRAVAIAVATEAAGAAGADPATPSRYRLVCHHCASEQRVPRACPECGAVELAGLGRGTQRLEEGLAELFPQARIGRLDRDVARRRGAARTLLDAAHAGEVDLLVGTQMLAKGHDFRRLTLVVVVDADSGLFAADFRAPERLFANLMQVAGRAGRHHQDSQVLVQTRYPEHPLFDALSRHDFDAFAESQLQEREQSSLPPFSHQALLTAQARSNEAAMELLSDARSLLLGQQAVGLTVCDPVPMPLAQVRGDWRAQMLIESASRKSLHAALVPWLDILRARRSPVRWQLVVDPLEI